MLLFRRLIWVALAVALLVGSVQFVVQEVWATPLILAAETYEDQKAAPAPEVMSTHDHAHSDEHADASMEPWSPGNGMERTLWTWVAQVLHSFSMSTLMLVVMCVAVARWRRPLPVWRIASGVALAGWLSFSVWPTLGLPAELPGMDAARLGSRQGWWVLAAASAAAGCALLAWAKGPWRWLGAAACLALPHVVGAPHLAGDPLAGFSAQAQTALRVLEHQFVQITTLMAGSFWLCLGGVGGLAFRVWILPLLGSLRPTAMASQSAPVPGV